MKYQIHISDKTYDLEIENQQVDLKILYEGKPVDFDFQEIHSNLFSLILEGKQYRVWLVSLENGDYKLLINQNSFTAVVEDERQQLRKAFRAAQKEKSGVTDVRAPMPGLVTQVEVESNQSIKAGQGLVVIEAMKMENEIKSPVAGEVTKIHIKKGDAIEKNARLLEINTR
jgi:pyruvate carboxylase subunit B